MAKILTHSMKVPFNDPAIKADGDYHFYADKNSSNTLIVDPNGMWWSIAAEFPKTDKEKHKNTEKSVDKPSSDNELMLSVLDTALRAITPNK